MQAAFISPMVFFLAGLAGDIGNDIASLLPAQDYFASRKIEVSASKMMELAAKEPTDGKSSIQQLLALRVLAEDPSRLKEGAGFAANLKILEDIAAGKKAQDKLGFSRQYAGWAVASLTDKKMMPPPASTKLAEKLLNWFPDVGLVAAIDIAGYPGSGQSKDIRQLINLFVAQLSPNDKNEIYAAVEEFGNICIERGAIGFLPDPINGEDRVYYRLTGKADHKLVSEFLIKVGNFQKVEKKKGANNEPIAILSGRQFDPSFALVGDSDFLMAINLKNIGADQDNMIKQMLEVRSGQKASVLKGKMEAEFKKINDKAYALAVGTIPAEMRRELGPPRGPFSLLPSSVLFDAQRGAEGIDLRFHGKLNKGDDTKAFIDDCLKLRGQVMTQLKLDGKEFPFPVEPILKTLSSIKMDAKDDGVAASVRVTNEHISVMLSAFTKLAEKKGKKLE